MEEPTEKTAIKIAKQPRLPSDAKFDAMKKESVQISSTKKASKRTRTQKTSSGTQQVSSGDKKTSDQKASDQKASERKTTEQKTSGPKISERKASERKTSSVKEKVVEVVNQNNKMDVEPPVEAAAGPVVGENLQETVQHGEYLLDFPTLSIGLNFAEVVLTLLELGLAIGAIQRIGPSNILIINSVLVLLFLAGLTAIQWKSLHIREEKTLNGQVQYVVDRKARRCLAGIHLLRLSLVFATFLILIYYLACGDESLGLRKQSVCRADPNLSKPLLGVALSLFAVQLLLITTHLFFYFRNRLSVRSCSGQ